MAKTVIEILNGIYSHVQSKHHGAKDKDGKPVDIGLLRDKGEDIKDQRVMDGFNVKVVGKTLIIKYHCEERLDAAHKRDFEVDIKKIFADIVKFLKKEYRNHNKDSLNLRKPSEVEIVVQPVSMRTVIVQANQSFEIGNMDDVEDMRKPSEDKLKDTYQKFLDLGAKKGPKSKNDFRKASDEEETPVIWRGK
jgi:hypothetical protein